MTEKQWRVWWNFKETKREPYHGKWEADPEYIRQEYQSQKGFSILNRVWIEEREITYSDPREVSVEEVG